jgi:hypothetical protein
MAAKVRGFKSSFFSVKGSILLVLAVGALLRIKNKTQPFIDLYGWRKASVADG